MHAKNKKMNNEMEEGRHDPLLLLLLLLLLPLRETAPTTRAAHLLSRPLEGPAWTPLTFFARDGVTPL